MSIELLTATSARQTEERDRQARLADVDALADPERPRLRLRALAVVDERAGYARRLTWWERVIGLRLTMMRLDGRAAR